VNEFGEAIAVLWALILDVWLSFWRYMGGWEFFGPLIIVLWGLGLIMANDSRRDRKRKRKQDE
jgi:hypothetical protein